MSETEFPSDELRHGSPFVSLEPKAELDENDIAASTHNVKPLRTRALTKVGKEYLLQQLHHKRSVAALSLERHQNHCLHILQNALSHIAIREAQSNLQDSYAAFAMISEALIDQLETELDKQEAKLRFDEKSILYRETASKITDAILRFDSDNKSKQSSVSGRSSVRSTASTLQLKRVDAAIKRAAVEAEMSFVEAEATLRAETSKLQLQKELAKVKAEETALAKFELGQSEPMLPKVQNTDDGTYTLKRFIKDTKQTGPDISRSYLTLDAEYCAGDSPPEQRNVQNPQPSHSNSPHTSCGTQTPHQVPHDSDRFDPTVINLMETLVDIHQESSLPKQEPDIFDGNVLNFPTWIRDFNELMEKPIKSAGRRLSMLGKYTSGDAKKCIEAFVGLTSDKAYEAAKSELIEWFGNPAVITRAYKKRLKEWPVIPYANGGSAIRDFAHFLRNCESLVENSEYVNSLDDDDLNQTLVLKLPKSIRDRWARKVCDFEEKFKAYPKFSEFSDFVVKEAKVAMHSVCGTALLDKVISDGKMDQTRKRQERGVSSFATLLDDTSNAPIKLAQKPRCYYCEGNHGLDDCRKFSSKSHEEKMDFLKRRGICFGCLIQGHISRGCFHRKICDTCGRHHPTIIHVDGAELRKERIGQNGISNSTAAAAGAVCHASKIMRLTKTTRIVPVKVHHVFDPHKEVLVYALLDEQSDITFVLDAVCNELGLNGNRVRLSLSTMTTSTVIDSRKIQGLKIKGRNGCEIQLPPSYTRMTIPVDRDQIVTKEVLKRYPYLDGISEQIPEYMSQVKVGLLIGTNCMKAIRPLEIISDPEKDTYAVRTLLGWGVVGLINEDGEEETKSNCQSMLTQELHTGKPLCHSFVALNQAKEILNPYKIIKVLERDFNDLLDLQCSEEYKNTFGISKALSVEDRKFLETCEKEIHRTRDGHYELPLPFRENVVFFPDNRSLALKRLKGIERRLRKDEEYKRDYVAFMNNIITHGYAEKVPEDELVGQHGRLWYIPHHGVYHPRKPGKIRVVFNCSVEYQGYCLNKSLLSGPDLTNKLLGVLLRFRQNSVAIMGDIESMYYQVRVNKAHRDYLRFFWWIDGDFSKPPSEFRMCVHLFGGVSSPGCANFALKSTANDYEKDFDKAAANFLRNDFYVDDGLKSVEDVPAAITLIESSKNMCRKGGFNLTKFISNDSEVLSAINESDRAKAVKELDFGVDKLPIERALGVQWCIEDDSFTFAIVLKDRPFTRRGILSTVCSIYDPFGFVAPVVLEGKRILQELCKDGHDWDDEVPVPLRLRWEKWRNELHVLRELKVKRCYKPVDFGTVANVELHHFSDAATGGYGQCSYIRLINEEGDIHCSFVLGKARVSPLKPVTIPRLELTAAVVSVKVAALIRNEIEFSVVNEIFWTDSKVVLGYIANEARRFHTYVAHRVQRIHDNSKKDQWAYVESKDNPADDTSRGLHPCQLVDSDHRYLKGPGFLWHPMKHSALTGEFDKLKEEDPEVKHSVVNMTKTEAEGYPEMLGILSRFSCWNRARRFVAILSRPYKVYSRKKNKYQGEITVEEIKEAEAIILRLFQQFAFATELESLRLSAGPNRRECGKVKPSSQLYCLDPVLSDDGLVKVGGRLQCSSLCEELKHPVILPKSGHVTNLIIRFLHEKVNHQGRGITLNEIRSSGYWIISGIAAVSRYISTCVTCRKLRGAALDQKMGNLPTDRTEIAPPFTYCGLDAFGPFMVKNGRKELKRYGILFTCLASRAIRIEIAPSMETDTFINALRRFICRNGPVRQIRCDQGSNFMGAANELTKAAANMNHRSIGGYLLEQNCDYVNFKFNVPGSSSMGGVWERQIRTVRSVLSAILQKNGQQLNDDSLITFTTEAEAIVNSRPLTVENLGSCNSPLPLCPNQLLTCKTRVVLPPPGVFDRADLYSRKQWRRVQHLSNEFWQRWRKEYVQTLQVRKKWNKHRRNLQIGDVVMIIDENLVRNVWKLARVVKTYPSGTDGRIRKVQCKVATSLLDDNGKPTQKPCLMDRPVQKLVLLCEHDSIVG